MNRCSRCLKSIQQFYHEIDKVDEYILFEHNSDVEEPFIIVDTMRNCYTYTSGTILSTLDSPRRRPWFKFAIIY